MTLSEIREITGWTDHEVCFLYTIIRREIDRYGPQETAARLAKLSDLVWETKPEILICPNGRQVPKHECYGHRNLTQAAKQAGVSAGALEAMPCHNCLKIATMEET